MRNVAEREGEEGPKEERELNGRLFELKGQFKRTNVKLYRTPYSTVGEESDGSGNTVELAYA